MFHQRKSQESTHLEAFPVKIVSMERRSMMPLRYCTVIRAKIRRTKILWRWTRCHSDAMAAAEVIACTRHHNCFTSESIDTHRGEQSSAKKDFRLQTRPVTSLSSLTRSLEIIHSAAALQRKKHLFTRPRYFREPLDTATIPLQLFATLRLYATRFCSFPNKFPCQHISRSFFSS